MNPWYSRPVLFVASVERALAFYVDRLGFTERNRYEEDGIALVGQVSREGCTILFTSQFPEKNGHGRIFIELNQEELDTLRTELETRGAPIEQGWWGYETTIVRDPDGNELFFPHPD